MEKNMYDWLGNSLIFTEKYLQQHTILIGMKGRPGKRESAATGFTASGNSVKETAANFFTVVHPSEPRCLISDYSN